MVDVLLCIFLCLQEIVVRQKRVDGEVLKARIVKRKTFRLAEIGIASDKGGAMTTLLCLS